ncbi:uncharacterized protein LOC144107807 [Amblyomma americanum]
MHSEPTAGHSFKPQHECRWGRRAACRLNKNHPAANGKQVPAAPENVRAGLKCQDVRLHLQRPQRGSGWRFGRRHTDGIGRPLSWEPSAVAAGGSSRCADHPSQHPWSHRRLLSDVIEKKVALPVWPCTAREWPEIH